MRQKNIMIFPAGSELGLELHRAFRDSKFVKVYGGTSVSDHAAFTYENLITGIPYIGTAGFVDKLNKAIRDYEIDYIYPAYDTVQVYLMEHQAEIDAKVVSADLETVQLLRSKKRTYDFLAGELFIPKTWNCAKDVPAFPVFVKPAESQGSEGARKINSREELEQALKLDSSLVICEYLSGDEVTVDCLTDQYGKLRSAKMRSRDRIRMGIAVRSRLLPLEDEVCQIAEILNERFRFVGAWFFQLKKNDVGAYRLLEVSPRIPGTCGLSRNVGINYPLLTLFVMWGYDISLITNDYEITLDRAFYSAYQINMDYETIYLDFDDTLLVNDRVNVTCIQLIYQWINQGKRIILLSKHTTNLQEDLQRYHIAETLFDDIIVIANEDEKVAYIEPERAIFIDDSFAERKKVKDTFDMPVFDVDMLEALIEYRR